MKISRMSFLNKLTIPTVMHDTAMILSNLDKIPLKDRDVIELSSLLADLTLLTTMSYDLDEQHLGILISILSKNRYFNLPFKNEEIIKQYRVDDQYLIKIDIECDVECQIQKLKDLTSFHTLDKLEAGIKQFEKTYGKRKLHKDLQNQIDHVKTLYKLMKG